MLTHLKIVNKVDHNSKIKNRKFDCLIWNRPNPNSQGNYGRKWIKHLHQLPTIKFGRDICFGIFIRKKFGPTWKSTLNAFWRHRNEEEYIYRTLSTFHLVDWFKLKLVYWRKIKNKNCFQMNFLFILAKYEISNKLMHKIEHTHFLQKFVFCNQCQWANFDQIFPYYCKMIL